MEKIARIVDNLYDGFTVCKDANECQEGGVMRAAKGQVWEDFTKEILLHVIARKKLPYFIENKKKVSVLVSDNGGLSIEIEMDICCLINITKEPVYHVEVKDYIDASMYKRFVADSLILSKKFPKMKHISLSGWVASAPNTQSAINSILGLSGSVFADTLLPMKRNSKNNLFLLSQPKTKIITSTEALITRLSEIIK